MKMDWDFLIVLAAYLVGSIPFSYIFPALKGVDVRKVGSGNVGGTNAIRAAGPAVGALSMLADASKALVVVLIVRAIGAGEMWACVAGMAAVLGHDYPLYLRFHGGKGVACTLGFIFAFVPLYGAEFVGIWLLITAVTQYVSVASMSALVLITAQSFVWGNREFAFSLLILTSVSIYRHRSNVVRLIKGRENKMNIIGSIRELLGGGKKK